MGVRDPGQAQSLHRRHADGRRDESLLARAIGKVHALSGGAAVSWCADGWGAYKEAFRRAYSSPLKTGRVGRPPLVVPEGLYLTQTIKHRDERGRLVEVERVATIGTAAAEHPGRCTSSDSMECSGTVWWP